MSFYHRRQLHDLFETRVYTELKQHGFTVHDLTYHRHLGDDTIARLKRLRTPTALLIRTRADRIAIHQHTPAVLKIEVKTSGYANGGFAIEAFPLATHIVEAEKLGAHCLYICFQRAINHEFGFWANDIRENITGIYVPPLWHSFLEEFPDWIRCAFPHTPVYRLRQKTQGSNTPYVMVAPSAVRTMAHWRTLMHEWLENAPSATPAQTEPSA